MEITGTPGLPIGYSYWYEAENDNEFMIKIKEIREEETALRWVKQLSWCSFTVWRVDKTYRQGYETLFKKHFRCHHSATMSTKDTKCKAFMNIRIMRNRTVDQWPCLAHFRGKHNHEVGAPFSIVYHPITEDIKKEILELFKSGYHQYNAYSAFCKKNISQLGLDSWAFFADKYIFPTKEDFKQLWMRYVRDTYVVKMAKKKQNDANIDSSSSKTMSQDDNTNPEDNNTMDVQDLDEEYFGKRMIDETSNRLDANLEKPLENIKSANVHLTTKGKSEITVESKANLAMIKQCNAQETLDKSVKARIKSSTNVSDYQDVSTSNESYLQNILKRIKPQLENMTKENLIAFCIQRIVEEISAKAAVKDLHRLLIYSRQNNIENSQNYLYKENAETSSTVNVVVCTSAVCDEHSNASVAHNLRSINEVIFQQTM